MKIHSYIHLCKEHSRLRIPGENHSVFHSYEPDDKAEDCSVNECFDGADCNNSAVGYIVVWYIPTENAEENSSGK